MPKINNDALYLITQVYGGCTWPGTTPEGKTVQFSFGGMVEALKEEADLLYFNNAKKVGQTVVGNAPGVSASTTTLNEGSPFFGTLNTFPATLDTHIDFIVKIETR